MTEADDDMIPSARKESMALVKQNLEHLVSIKNLETKIYQVRLTLNGRQRTAPWRKISNMRTKRKSSCRAERQDDYRRRCNS